MVLDRRGERQGLAPAPAETLLLASPRHGQRQVRHSPAPAQLCHLGGHPGPRGSRGHPAGTCSLFSSLPSCTRLPGTSISLPVLRAGLAPAGTSGRCPPLGCPRGSPRGSIAPWHRRAGAGGGRGLEHLLPPASSGATRLSNSSRWQRETGVALLRTPAILGRFHPELLPRCSCPPCPPAEPAQVRFCVSGFVSAVLDSPQAGHPLGAGTHIWGSPGSLGCRLLVWWPGSAVGCMVR